MRILLDCDNVICDTTRSVLDVHYEKTGERLSVDDIKTYYIENYVSPKYKDDFYTIFLDKRVWKGVQVLPHCVEVVERLHNAGHEIWIATSTEATNVHKKARFLQRTFPFLNIRKRLITTPYKQILNADLLIDDCVDNVINAQYISILMTYPWNANYDDASDENIYRVNNWLEVEPMIEYIQTLKNSNENKAITSGDIAKKPNVVHSNSVPLLLDNKQIGVVRQIENGVMSGEIYLGNLSVEMLQLNDNKYEVKVIRIKH